MNRHIFREYDIRGIADTDLTDDVVTTIGRALGTYYVRNGAKRVVVGQDVRTTSPRIAAALTRGLTACGIDVVRIGMVPTPAVYFAVYEWGMDGGVAVTGSHNPVEFNGFKMNLGKASIYGPMIQELLAIAGAGQFAEGHGVVTEKDVLPEYHAALRRKLSLSRPLKVVIDAGNGCAGPHAPGLFRDLGCTVEELYTEPDGRFPNHLPDPTVPALIQDLIARVKDSGADLGIGYDGDADRVGLVDNTGRVVWGDQLLALAAADLLGRKPGAKVLFEVKCSQAVAEWVTKHGGTPILWKTGHSLIKAKMKEEGALLAGEMSGHMFFAEEWYGFDDALYASGKLASIVAASGRSLAELVDELPHYESTPERRYECDDAAKFDVVAQVVAHFRKTREVVDVDGARILFGDGWGLVRASNTQPVLVVRFEAKTKPRLAAIEAEVMGFLAGFPTVKTDTLAGH
jgi:phosphomannomutase/phosphoglucomutase